MMYYCVGINTSILISVSQLGTLFASGASFWCYININELYIKKRLLVHFWWVIMLNFNILGTFRKMNIFGYKQFF